MTLAAIIFLAFRSSTSLLRCSNNTIGTMMAAFVTSRPNGVVATSIGNRRLRKSLATSGHDRTIFLHGFFDLFREERSSENRRHQAKSDDRMNRHT